MSNKFDRRPLLITGLLVTALLLNAVITYRNTRQLDENAAWVTHTHEVLGALEDLLGSVRDAETGQRGYILTADPLFLEPYQLALGEHAEKLQRVEGLTRDNERQQERLRGLKVLIERRFAIIAQTLQLYRQGNVEEARQLVRNGDGRRVMDEIRVLAGEIEAKERDILRQREHDRSRAYTTVVGGSIVMLGFGLVGVVGIVWIGGRFLRDRSRATALREHQEFLEATVSSLGDGVIVTDITGNVTLLNGIAERLTGWTQADALNRPMEEIFRLVQAQTRAPVENPVRRALAEKRVVLLPENTLLIAKNGTEWPLDDSAAPIRSADGTISGAVVVFREISERHRAERVLAEANAAREELLASIRTSEIFLRSVLENSPDCIKVLDLEGKLLEMNRPGLCAMEIADIEPFCGADWASMWPEAGKAEARKAVALAAQGQIAHFEGFCPTATGKPRYWNVRVAPIPGADGCPARLVGVSRDVTFEKDATQALRDSEERFRAFMDHCPAIAFMKDLDGRFVYVNETVRRRFGVIGDEWIGKTDYELFDAKFADQYRAHDLQVLHGNDAIVVTETTPMPSGEIVSWKSYKFPFFDQSGRQLLAGMSMDMTEEVKASAALRASEDKFRNTVDRLAEGIFVVDVSTQRFVEANTALLTMLGYTLAEFTALTQYDLVADETPESFANKARQIHEAISKEGRYDAGHSRFWRKDGGVVLVELRITWVPNGEAGLHAVIVRDITEQVEAENRLFEYQVELEEANTKLRTMAITDGLTGINNRVAFDRRLIEEYERATRYGHPLSVVMMDVDYFKQFNDTFGHPAGDEILKNVAGIFKKTARVADFVARYGGEEFVLILPDTDFSGAMVMAERCRRAIAGTGWEKRAISVSVGVSTLMPSTASSEEMIEQADQALYRSKQLGRNRVSHGNGRTLHLPQVPSRVLPTSSEQTDSMIQPQSLPSN